jgi:hypothetical protein
MHSPHERAWHGATEGRAGGRDTAHMTTPGNDPPSLLQACEHVRGIRYSASSACNVIGFWFLAKPQNKDVV